MGHDVIFRRRRRQKHRKWIPAAIAAGLMTVGTAPVAINILAKHGVDVPGASSVQSIMALLDQRSPGERTKGELTKTKRQYRVLSSASWPAVAKTLPPAMPQAVEGSPFLPPEAPPEFQLASFAPGSISPPVTFGGGGGSGGGGGGGCCGSGGGGGGNTPTDNPGTPPVPAVPEPSTWAMLLIGFGAIGSALRRQRRERILAPAV
ncbi:PEPxxWA-CTERM sorting domain-containing protein [Sphingomonas rhizophila]|uniref:PEPxxWA-CTERM sorting domain-containing protein n=1 Tax=Sphingomonas rhizophila TaxID=2071607 RepID=UPI001FE73B6C|nr:PEPxxWA-CTERM sorting domain-containing protein [Sphingomonas rhizophila]